MKRKSALQLAIAEALNADRWINSEADLQLATARFLDALGLLWFHPANERKCTPVQGARLKRAGVKSGVPDVMIFTTTWLSTGGSSVPQHGCAIELKYGKNRPIDNQKWWLEQLRAHGWYTDVAYSMKDVVAILETCGYLKGV